MTIQRAVPTARIARMLLFGIFCSPMTIRFLLMLVIIPATLLAIDDGNISLSGANRGLPTGDISPG